MRMANQLVIEGASTAAVTAMRAIDDVADRILVVPITGRNLPTGKLRMAVNPA